MSRKKLHSLLVIIFLGLNFMIQPVAVFAQEPTGTPPAPTTTITAPPPFQPVVSTSAVGGNGNYSCPTAGIVGWGTLTPSSAWNLLCSQCVTTPMATSTAHPTGTSAPWAGTGTPPAGCTPMPFGTGTPSPYCIFQSTVTPTLSPTPISNPATITVSSVFGSCTSGPYVTCANNMSCTNTNAYTVDCTGSYTFNDNNTTFGSTFSFIVSVASSTLSPYWVFWEEGDIFPFTASRTLTTQYSGTADLGARSYPSGSWIVPSSVYPYYNITFNNTKTTTGIEKYVATITGIRFRISTLPIPPATPTPMATGTPNPNYCYSVSSVESGFSWSGVTLGATSCMDIGPYDGFDFGGLTANPIGAYPWLAHICLQDVSFGVAEIFGVSISLQVVLYILGIVALIRNMFVS